MREEAGSGPASSPIGASWCDLHDRRRTSATRPDVRADAVRGIGQHDVRVGHGREDARLARWAGERWSQQRAGGDALHDPAVLGLERSAPGYLTLERLLVGGLRVLPAAVDAGVQGGCVRRQRVVDVVIPQASLVEAHDQCAIVVDRRGRPVELGRVGHRRARSHDEHGEGHGRNDGGLLIPFSFPPFGTPPPRNRTTTSRLVRGVAPVGSHWSFHPRGSCAHQRPSHPLGKSGAITSLSDRPPGQRKP